MINRNFVTIKYNVVMRQLVVIAHDIRSTHNVGSLLRTADGLGIEKVFLTGYTPYPKMPHDTRLPHIASKLDATIHKTALGAELTVNWEQSDYIFEVLTRLKKDGYTICALEQTETSLDINSYKPPAKCALLLGSEVTGIATELLSACDVNLVIPMFGKKESFNVVQAAAMALFALRFSLNVA
jgi:23S rRNA (guanosine2251-2'-O)-methyltransferase